MKPLVSIIIPTYNVEKYIDQCLSSINRQTYENIEIIVVVDGATDKSYEIAAKWAETDGRISVLQQENAGAGPARNKGLKIAKGEYILFVDPDDWIDENMIYDYIEITRQHNIDMIVSGYYENYITESQTIITEKKFEQQLISNQLEVRKNYIQLYLKEAVCAPTRILYKKSIIDKCNVEFPDLRRSQDIVFNYRYFNYINSLYVTDKNYYHYRLESNNYLLKLRQDYYRTICIMYSDILDLHKNWNIEMTKEEYYRFNNRFLVLIGYYIESCILQNWIFHDVFSEQQLRQIAQNSKPIDLYHKIVKKALLSQNAYLLKIIISLKIFVKFQFKLIFKYIRRIKKY